MASAATTLMAFATCHFATLARSGDIIHEGEAIREDLAWKWQSGSEGQGVATDNVAIQKPRADGSTLESRCICSKTLNFRATDLRSVVS